MQDGTIKIIFTGILLNIIISLIAIGLNPLATTNDYTTFFQTKEAYIDNVTGDLNFAKEGQIMQQASTSSWFSGVLEGLLNIVSYVTLIGSFMFGAIVPTSLNLINSTNAIEKITWFIITLIILAIDVQIVKEFYYIFINKKSGRD